MSSFQERDKKYSGKRKKNKEQAKLNFDLVFMQTACIYIISENQSVHKTALVLLRNLFNSISTDVFENQQELIIRYKFVLRGLEARLDKHLLIKDQIISHIIGVMGNEFESINPHSLKEMSNSEVEWFENTISACVNALYINNSVLEMGDLCNDFYVADFNDKSKYIDLIKNKVNEMQSTFRRNDIDTDEEDSVVDLMNINSAINTVFNNIESPSYRLRTGMKGFNDILAGGFVGGRIYCLFGLPGEGKTITLLNLAYQLKEFNRDYVCKDKTKVPCILVLTMENTAAQTFETLYNIACDSKPIMYASREEAKDLVNMKLGISKDNPISIFVKYKPINSVNTDYVYALTEDLEDNGYEVICVIQDYIKRIRPVVYTGDMRQDLGTVINEFRNFAIYKNIPFITASQLNRDGVRTIDDKRHKNSHDLVSNIRRDMIGESGLIDENLDCTIFITPETVGDTKYMGVSCTKTRYRIDKNTNRSFYQPFVQDNQIKYVTDVNMSKPAYQLSLAQQIYNNATASSSNSINFNIRKEIKPKESTLNDFSAIDGTIQPVNDEVDIENDLSLNQQPSQQIQGDIDTVTYTKFRKGGLKQILHHEKLICRHVKYDTKYSSAL